MNSKFASLGLEVDKPARMILVHPTNRQPLRDAKGKDAYIELYSSDSDIARRHQQAIQRRRLAQRGRTIRITPEELEAEAVEFLASLTAAWHLVGLRGDHIDVPFSVENARELYAAAPLAWLREQVDEYVADRGNFNAPSLLN